MVVTMLVTGIPRFVSLTVLSYNLDSILSTDEVGKFRLREYTDTSDRHREVFVDFNSGFDAMCAQELLHDFELILENGSHNRLKAKIIGTSPSKLPSLSPSRKVRSRSRDRHSLLPYGSTDTVALDFDSRLQMIEKYKKVVKAETELVALKRKLQKEKKKFSQLNESSDTSESDSSSGSKRKRKKKSKKRSKSQKRSKKSYRSGSKYSPVPSTSGPTQSRSTSRLSSPKPSAQRHRFLKGKHLSPQSRRSSSITPRREHSRHCGDRIRTSVSRRSRSKHSPVPSTSATMPSCSRRRLSSPKPTGQRSRFLNANCHSPPSRRSSSITPRREHSRPCGERIRTSVSRRSRSRTRKLKSKSRSPKLYRNNNSSSVNYTRKHTERCYSNSRSNSRERKGYIRKDRQRKQSQSRSNSRSRKLRSPHRNELKKRQDLISPPHSRSNRRDETREERNSYKKSRENRRNSDGHPEIINVVRTTKNRIIELGSDEEPTSKSPKTFLKERPIITDEDRIVILNKLEEASKSIVNEINIAISIKHVAQLKVLNLTEKEQAITVIKKYVDNYLVHLIPESMALAMTVVGIVRNFRVSFSKDEENKLVEGIINDIIWEREKLAGVQVKNETSPILPSDWREVDDLLRDIENDDLTEKPNYSGIEVMEKQKRISQNPQFFLPIKKILKQMKSHILPLDFNDDENLEMKFIKKLRRIIRERIFKLLIGKDFVPTQEIIEIYRENYPFDGDLMFVNEVFIPIIKGTDTSDNEESNDIPKNDNDPNDTDIIKNIVDPGNQSTANINDTVIPANQSTANINDTVIPGNQSTANINDTVIPGNQSTGNLKNDDTAKDMPKNDVCGIPRNDANIVSENNAEGKEMGDWQSVKIKKEATSTCNDESPSNTTPSRPEPNTGAGQCIKLIITTIIKKEEDE